MHRMIKTLSVLGVFYLQRCFMAGSIRNLFAVPTAIASLIYILDAELD